MNRSRMIVLALLAVLALPATAQAAKAKPQLYVSLGDSYATGYQADANGGEGANTRNGFAYQLPALAKRRGYRYKLVNFGCGGETTASLLERKKRCAGPGPGGVDYAGRTQMAAAERFIKRNRGRVRLITVSIGGNDVTECAKAPDAVACVGGAVQSIERNVTTIAKRLRKAAGKKARIVGITYPDVILGAWVGENPNQDLARLSVVAFKEFINPTLKKAYAAAGGKFVDVTAATGAYEPLDVTTTHPTWGVIPTAVAKVCDLTYYCDVRDIHARTAGYRLIAELIAKTLPRR